MKRGIILSVLFSMLIVYPVLSAGTEVVREKRNVGNFTKIGFGVPGNLYISIGKEFKVELEGEKSLLDEIETEVSGGKLVIRKENWRWNNNDKVDVYITMPELTGLGVSGSGRAEIKDLVKTENLDLSVSGSGKLYTNSVNVGDLSCSISGSGDIFVQSEGTARNTEISISGSGNYSGDLLKIESADIRISGSGSCSIYATGSLDASVSGSGNVSYLGSPKIDARISGSGKVRSK